MSFLAHLSWRLKWAYLIKFCPLSMFVIVVVVVNFSPFHLHLQKQWANFNQTWHKASFGEGELSLFKWRAPPFSLWNSKITLTNLKHLLFQKHWANFNWTLHKASLGVGDSNFFKWRAPSFFQGEIFMKLWKYFDKFKNLFFQNHWANFNQT